MSVLQTTFDTGLTFSKRKLSQPRVFYYEEVNVNEWCWNSGI